MNEVFSVIMNEEIWEEAVLTCFNVLARLLSEESTREYHEN
jgi:hypothetical protein